jgi:hypothetical protein
MTYATWDSGIPASDKAIQYAARWGTMVESALRNGQRVPHPGIPAGMDPDDVWRGITGFYGVDSSIKDPREAVAQAVENIGRDLLETLDDRALQLEVVARRNAALAPRPASISDLTPEQAAALSYAIANGDDAADLTSDPTIPEDVRAAIAAAIPASTFEAQIRHDRLYPAPSDAEETSDASTEGAE